MTQEQPKRRYRKWTIKTDFSPVRRFCFKETEWKVMLEAVGHYADYLAQVKYPLVKKEWDRLVKENMAYHMEVLHGQWLGVKPGDPQYEAYQKVNSEKDDIQRKVRMLNLIERQIRLAFKLIDPKIPQWCFEVPGRVCH